MARRAMARSLADLGQVEQRLAEVRDGIAACRDEESGAARALAHAVEWGLGVTVSVLESRREVAATAVEHAQGAYRQRRRDLRAVTRLYETRREVWQAELQADEQQEIEEMARMQAWTRRRAVPS